MDEGQPRLLVVAGLVWLAGDRVLVQRRSAGARFGAGELELPGGKVERGEAPRTALVRELVEEWGPAAAELHVGAIAEIVHHVYPPPGPEVVMLVYHVGGEAWGDGWARRIAITDGSEAIEFRVGELPVEEFLVADRELARAIAAGVLRRALSVER